ncbi:MAG TPA: YciI family protein [Cryomorphaceae bacterium]|nr:YciI family protein [Cryomorphaceae bacterium]
MKTILLTLTFLSALNLVAQNPDYDAELAKELGADEYGMKMYTFVVLKTGPTQIQDKDSAAVLMRGHLDNIKRLAENDLLTVAGPFGQNDLQYRGLFILNVATKEEAEVLLSTDPAIAAGVFKTEIIPWYGSAALPTYLENHEKIEKKRP